MSKRNIESYFGPLQQFISRKTLAFRNATANPRAQAVILTDAVLRDAGVPEVKWQEFRGMAHKWAKKWSKSPLNDSHSQISGQEYIVLNDFNQVGSFFKRARAEKYLKKGSSLHRGHVGAVVREAAESSAKDVLGGLQRAGLDSTILDILENRMYRLLEAVEPALDYRFTRHIDNRAFNNNIEVSIIFPELKKFNLGKKEESALFFAVEAAVDQFLEEYGDLSVVKGSKSIMQATNALLEQSILGKGVKPYKKKDSGRIKPMKSRTKRKGPKGAPVPTLRDRKGQFTSPAAIQNIIQSQITEKVKENMGEGGSLVNRTGRFAESVTITNVTQTRQGSLTAFYNYMKYPYQTFERGFKQGSTRRDPRLLIHKSIREIAQKLVHRKLNIKSRRV